MIWLPCMVVLLMPPQNDPLVVTKDTTLDPAKTYGSIVIQASNVTVDGRGASVTGDMAVAPKLRQGTGISAKGVSGVTLRNVNVKGFETGLRIEDGEGWTIEGCDLSDNFHDPDYGWGENGRRGGLVLTRLHRSAITKNRANRVWDACNMVECDGNTIAENDFSRTSNTCLKFWTCSGNTVRGNNLSFGIRISEGEVHARDSTGVLIESGSNDNRFLGNDVTHGGDGIFVRVLNGWVSTGNHFEENDVSHANNNGFEAWSPGNTYVRNRANRCSYGFWLGASDKTVLIDNEAAWNGSADGPHNSPHLPDSGFAGIVFMFGPSSHTVLRGNHCHHNNGAGIAAIGDDGGKFRAFHWIVERNRLEHNRWGIYVKNADWIDLAGNTFEGNGEDVKDAGKVTNLNHRESGDGEPPKAVVRAPATIRAGAKAVFDASASQGATAFRWDFGDGMVRTEARVEKTFAEAGFYRVGLTVSNGAGSDLGFVDAFVTEEVDELRGEWDVVDPGSRVAFSEDREVRIQGETSTRAIIDPYSGMRCELRLRGSWSLRGKKHIVFWLRYRNTNIPAWQGPNPVVTLSDGKGTLRLTPEADLMSQPAWHEGREGWNRFVVPLAGGPGWKKEGEAGKATSVSIGVDSWGASPLYVWIDGLGLE